MSLTKKQSQLYQYRRVGHLLHMKYKPSELAREIGAGDDHVIYRFLKAGCPHEKDQSGRIWIVGTEFRDWLKARRSEQHPPKQRSLQPGESFCVTCKHVVKPDWANAELVTTQKSTQMLRAKCPNCSANLTTWQKIPRKQDDQP